MHGLTMSLEDGSVEADSSSSSYQTSYVRRTDLERNENSPSSSLLRDTLQASKQIAEKQVAEYNFKARTTRVLNWLCYSMRVQECIR